MLQSGTYVRESDGAGNMYHAPTTGWNFPLLGLQNYLQRDPTKPWSSMMEWRLVNSERELAAVKEWLGSNLKPGEYFSVNEMEIARK